MTDILTEKKDRRIFSHSKSYFFLGDRERMNTVSYNLRMAAGRASPAECAYLR